MPNLNPINPQQAPQAASGLPDPNEVVDSIQLSQEGQQVEASGPPTSPIQGLPLAQLQNYVDDETVMKQLREDILPYIKLARDNRQSKIEQDWIRYRDIYNLRRTVVYYEGRSKLFIPAVKKAIDVLTRIAKDAIFSDPYLGIETDIPRYKDVALELMKWLLEDQAKLRDKLAMFLRQLYQIGTSCLKITWKEQTSNIKYREFDKEIGELVTKSRKEHSYHGPKIDVIDMRHVYVWPETAVDYDSLRLVFEDSTIKTTELEDKASEGLYDILATARGLANKSATLETQRLAESQAGKENVGDTTNALKDVLDITYCWAKFKLPGQTEEQWNQVVMLNDDIQCVIRVAENPWWFQKPNYLFGSLFQEHDYFYGHGIIEMLEMWQYMVNDTANQTMDTATFTLNPIVAYDPGSIDDPDQLEIQPMAKWPISPKMVQILRPPVEMSQVGVTMLQFLISVIQESSDATALVQGAPRIGLGSATSTATGVSQLFSASNAAIIDQVDTLQSQVLTPLVHYVEIMLHEFLDSDLIIRKLGPDGVTLTQRIIRPQDLMLSTDVRWIASNRLREKAAKVQQLINFFNIAAKIPPQVTMQQGFTIDFKEITKDIYSGLGLPNIDRVIRDSMNAVPGISPELEEMLIETGRTVYASPVDTPQNHQAHLQAHMQFRTTSELARVRMMEHVASHYQAVQQIQMQMAQAQAKGGGKGAPGSALQPGVGERSQEQPGGETADALKGILSQVGMS